MNVLTTEHQREVFAAGAFIRVVNWHNTPMSERHQLKAELASYASHYEPVVPEDLDRFYETGKWGKTKPGLIVAFYDGYLNNATVAAPVCDELGLTAWFFPPTTFPSVAPESQRDYADAHEIILVPEERQQSSLAMTWSEIESISRRHVVAGHTANHAAANEVLTAADVEREVLEPIRLIHEMTGRLPPAFAWLHGTAFDPNSVACRAVRDAGIRYLASNTAYQRIGD